MPTLTRVPQLLATLRTRWSKVIWGVRVVGVPATCKGAVRLMRYSLTRPPTVRAGLASGGSLTFDYPSQLVPALVVFGDLIDPEYDFLRRTVDSGVTVVDVGAAIGQFTVFAARLPGSVVHAYEPSASNIASLERNLATNGITDRVVVHHCALDDHEGETRFATAANTFLSRPDQADTGDTELVPVHTLTGEMDRLGLDRIGILKINVAGFEPSVLDGAQAFLAAKRADVLILLIGVGSLTWYARLRTIGYRAFFYHPRQDTLFEVSRFDQDFLTKRPWPARHLLLLHPAAVERAVARGLSLAVLPED